MTTPDEARILANSQYDLATAYALRTLANQVERLEAQRKELREALQDLLDADPGYEWGGYSQSELSARQKAATVLIKATQ